MRVCMCRNETVINLTQGIWPIKAALPSSFGGARWAINALQQAISIHYEHTQTISIDVTKPDP